MPFLEFQSPVQALLPEVEWAGELPVHGKQSIAKAVDGNDTERTAKAERELGAQAGDWHPKAKASPTATDEPATTSPLAPCHPWHPGQGSSSP